MTLPRYFGLLGLIATLAVVAYGVAQLDNAPLAVSKHIVNGKYQDRWSGCYYDTRASATRCTED